MSAKLQVIKMLPSFLTIPFVALSVVAPAVVAQTQQAPATQAPANPPIAPATPTVTSQAQESSEPQTLHLLVGRSLVITSPSRG